MKKVKFFSFVCIFIIVPSVISFGEDFDSFVLASYEPQEINDLSVSVNSVKDPTLTATWPVLGGVNDVPPATDGEYVLKMTWTNDVNNKVEVRHDWNDLTFDLAGVDFIHFDLYVVDESAISDTDGVGIWDNEWEYPWVDALCEPCRPGEWRNITLVVAHLNEVNLDHIEALVLDKLAGTSGTVYIDNLRLGAISCVCKRKIQFAGYNWCVHRSGWPSDVGPNYFTDEPNDLFVDCYGNLNLSVVNKDPNWYCSNVMGGVNLGYGRYIYTIKASEKMLDPNIVLGLFIYDVPDANGRPREIDFELSRWWDPNEPNNAQYVVQPWDTPGNRYRFPLDEHRTTTHEIIWTPDVITFKSYYGDYPLTDDNDLITSWRYTGGDIPYPGTENPIMNLWLLPPQGSPPGTPGAPPSDEEDARVIIKKFLYLPVPGDLSEDGRVDFIDLALFAENWLVGVE
jgi:hypothetical protein